MRIVKAPRATWQTCWHHAVSAAGLLLVALSGALFIVAIWANDPRWAGTAGVVIFLGFVTAMVGALNHNDYRKHDTFAIPLPWRRSVEDVR